ncbi:uncharacterized protein BO66DRAFT_460054 [Aspergillus aculeatinus CBS 121060]|uniref:Uncharacterized protein n=1 Tax=Aspergillus aculeatinus CBS 121060 TaxID=1448322 RepID=A0ACD1GYE9_9EURO|nr:hypothetical protein BO66DRAFT_460054 [Aspergillus aculeatinus CBS 121060]RAH66319.1 hypothetical protein BO66DRAFT_460054 [Aspergillus aculeatinus CBS 121060]
MISAKRVRSPKTSRKINILGLCILSSVSAKRRTIAWRFVFFWIATFCRILDMLTSQSLTAEALDEPLVCLLKSFG